VNIAVIHHEVRAGAPADERDVLVQTDVVREALMRLGHRAYVQACTLDMENARQKLTRSRADGVFNLVETLEGTGRLIHLFPALLDVMGLPYTGSGSLQMLTTSNKVLAKWILSSSGLPTPLWVGPFPEDIALPGKIGTGGENEEMWIIKSVWEHASVGLNERSVLRASSARVREILPERSREIGGPCFAEIFVSGREFNLSLLSGENGPEVLPPAEILFVDFPDDSPRILDYRAKWDETSDAYRQTPGNFETAPGDLGLVDRMSEIALRCWEVFNLGGYARVDFRVDREGIPWVLEVNTNPCLSPDAGFAAALDRAGIPFVVAVERILSDAFAGR
jgi:D-alanine-D-alanine ligase